MTVLFIMTPAIKLQDRLESDLKAVIDKLLRKYINDLYITPLPVMGKSHIQLGFKSRFEHFLGVIRQFNLI